MATTTNFGWETPDDTDLVKDGALAMRTLGNAIDASLVDLKGGTTGQVLSKNSNTDMDFTWVTSDDANAIQNAIVDAKGDLIAASAADTPARLAVGNNGETLVADSSASTGLRWQGNYSAGKNKVINGAFDIWQRGTSFTSLPYGGRYADRFLGGTNGTGATRTVSQQTFTPGSAPVAGYEGQYFLRIDRSVAGTGSTFDVLDTQLEDVRTFAGQTITVSFWAKMNANTTISGEFQQLFGSGGSGTVGTSLGNFNLTTSWQRFSATINVPSVSGKTIGTGSHVVIRWSLPINTTYTFDLWGVQAEAGSVATAFQTATGTLAGELAACQRYYYRQTALGNYTVFATGGSTGSTNARFAISYPVQMRVAPTSLDYSTLAVAEAGGSVIAATSAALDGVLAVLVNVSSGLTQYRSNFLYSNNSTSAYIGFSAEL